MARISPDQIAVLRDKQAGVLAARLQEQEVCEYWGVIFAPKNLASLTRQDIKGFLRYEQNHRWRELSREDVAADMPRLRQALLMLLDDERPIAERLNALEPGRGELAVPHLGKAKLGAILLVTHPRAYGVWNDYSERALQGMGLMPEFATGARLGDQYAAVNAVLVELATTYRLTMWRLDMLLEQLARMVH